MLFFSIEYLFFLPIVFLIYWAIGYAWINDLLKLRLQNAFVVVASYVFYAWWDWRFLGLLFGMSLFSWLSGRMIAKCQNSTEGLRGGQNVLFANESGELRVKSGKIWLWLCIAVDLLILGLFKYYNFFVSSFADLFGLHNSIHSLKIVLPLGMSFFTFQAISYVVDVYKRKIEPTNLIDCLFYIGFFPKLLAGPIERPTNLIPQIKKNRVFEYDLAADGMRQILWGLFKKVVVSDTCALYVNDIWSHYETHTGSVLMLAAILYTIQFYGDFSGYSDIAIGSAKLLGFRFRDNFLFPYFSRNMNEFWRRWHISLNTWFVDYVYIPLGGSRNGKWRTICNTMIIFLLSGLWHGADWSFVAWGTYHGLLLVILILLNRNTKYEQVVAHNRWLPSIRELAQMLLVFMLATIGWILFRADNIGQAWDYMCGMMQWGTLRASYRFFLPDDLLVYPANMLIILMLVVEWVQRNKHHGLEMRDVKWYVRYPIYAFIMGMIVYFSNSAATFIYFQF